MAASAKPRLGEAPEVFDLPHGPVTVHWRRSERARRVSLRIDARTGVVVLTVPARSGRAAARGAGMALLTGHAGWVADRLSALPSPVAFAAGAEVTLAGVLHRIHHVPGGRGGVWLEAGAIHVSGEASFLARRVGDWLRAEARRRLAAKVVAKCTAAGLAAHRVTVKDTRTRWGSCTPDGTLMFSWRLVMAPDLVQDYVVGHEVAHLRHMNHGPEFWRLVAELTPHKAAAVDWLKVNATTLMRAGQAIV